MSETTLRVSVASNDTLEAVITLEDPLGSYGVRDKDTQELIVPPGVIMLEVTPGSGVYEYTFENPGTGLTYQYFTRILYLGEVYYFEKFRSMPTNSQPALGRYSSQAGVEAMFGRTSVQEWATVDQENISKVSVIQGVLDDADDFVDTFINGGPFTVPFTGSIPTMITRVANTLAGCYLYEAKGELDYNVETGQQTNRLAWHRKRVTRWLEAIRTGKMDLQYPDGTDVPRTIGYPIAYNF